LVLFVYTLGIIYYTIYLFVHCLFPIAIIRR
jgi:hypothetical protein